MAALGGLAAKPTDAAPAKPNILFIVVDDLDTATAKLMPRIRQRLAAEGASFERAYAQYALCSPTRASMLTGRYAQNTDVQRNGAPHGGFTSFIAAGNHRVSVNNWLQGAGYRTGLIGKFINDYPLGLGGRQVPQGWDYWMVTDWAKPFGYQVNENGRWVVYGSKPADYDTDVYGRKAGDFIHGAITDRKPFALFLWFGQIHSPVAAAPRHAHLFPGAVMPHGRSWNEPDASDKPLFLQMPLMTAAKIPYLDGIYRERLRAAQAVDEQVELIYGLLRRRGQLGNTYIVLTSDNGFLMGEHRLANTKGFAYEESIRLPLLVRGPGVPAGRVVRRLVGVADFAPTFAAWAGVTPPVEVDGRSLTPLLGAANPAAVAWRHALPITRLREPPDTLPTMWTAAIDPSLTTGYRCVPTAATTKAIPHMRGVRTDRYTLAQYTTGDLELYDGASDPFQLDNRICGGPSALRAQLIDLAAGLSACRGAACRALEDTPVP